MNPGSDTPVTPTEESPPDEAKHGDIGFVEMVGIGLLVMMVLALIIALVMFAFIDPLGGEYEKIIR